MEGFGVYLVHGEYGLYFLADSVVTLSGRVLSALDIEVQGFIIHLLLTEE